MQNKINPRIVCEYIIDEVEEPLGYGVGIFLDKKNLILKDVDKIVDEIRKLNIDNIEDLVIDEYYDVEYDIYKEIKVKLGLGNIRRVDILIDLFDYVLEGICNYNKINLLEQNTLVISNDDDYTKRVVMYLSQKVKYLTINGENDNFINNLGDEVFNDSGLSIFKTSKLKDKIKSYNLIINLRDNAYIEVEKIKKKTIVFDYSIDCNLSYIIRDKRKDILIIDDYIFREKLIQSKPLGFSFNKEVSSNIYSLIRGGIDKKDLIKIKVKDKTYTIKQASKIYLNRS